MNTCYRKHVFVERFYVILVSVVFEFLQAEINCSEGKLKHCGISHDVFSLKDD